MHVQRVKSFYVHIDQNRFLKNYSYVPEFVGFQTRVILDLWGVPQHAMMVLGLEHNFSFKSSWAYCGASENIQKIQIFFCIFS